MSINQWDIITGDCIPVMKELYENKTRPTLIFADPPYNIGLDYGLTTDDRRSQLDYLAWCRKWIAEAYLLLKYNGSCWILINHEYGAYLEIIARDTGFVIANWLTWYESFGVNCKQKFTRSSRRLLHCVKDPDDYIFNKSAVMRPSARQEIYSDKRASPEGRIWDDVWGVNPPIPRLCGTHKERLADFPTQLPVKFLLPIVGCASHPGDLVLDLFNGSGTTGEACLRLKRLYIGIEINQLYADRSRDRLARIKTDEITTII